jgi:hypothetical protein
MLFEWFGASGVHNGVAVFLTDFAAVFRSTAGRRRGLTISTRRKSGVHDDVI